MVFHWETIIYKAYSPPADPKHPGGPPTVRDEHRKYGPATSVQVGYFEMPCINKSEFHWLCTFKTPPPTAVLRALAEQMASAMTLALVGAARVGNAQVGIGEDLYYVDFAVDDAVLPSQE
ncbi:MAG: hypothetical protein JWO42_2678 [Chloroflexi bacterium]|jgi:hypothetical protein|nr:hypothetical protein [Chloroflexota bacterium]